MFQSSSSTVEDYEGGGGELDIEIRSELPRFQELYCKGNMLPYSRPIGSSRSMIFQAGIAAVPTHFTQPFTRRRQIKSTFDTGSRGGASPGNSMQQSADSGRATSFAESRKWRVEMVRESRGWNLTTGVKGHNDVGALTQTDYSDNTRQGLDLPHDRVRVIALCLPSPLATPSYSTDEQGQ